MATWHTSLGGATRSSLSLEGLARRVADRLRRAPRPPTALAWHDHHNPEAEGYHHSLGANRPEAQRRSA
jgi:hypothetical protein